MADPRAHAHPEPHEPIDDGFEDDPLTELTRIVSDRAAPPPAWTPPRPGGPYGRATPQAVTATRQPASARLPAMQPYVPPVEPPPPPPPVMAEPEPVPVVEPAPIPVPQAAEPLRPAPRPPVRPLFPTAAQAALDARARGATRATAQDSYAFFAEQRSRGAAARGLTDPEGFRDAAPAAPAGGEDPLAELARLASDPALFERTFRRPAQPAPQAQPAYDPVAEEEAGLFDEPAASRGAPRGAAARGYLDDDAEDLARNQAPSATSTVDAYVPGDLESHAVPEVEETHPAAADPRRGRDPYGDVGWAATAAAEAAPAADAGREADPYYDDAPVWRDPSGVPAVDMSGVDNLSTPSADARGDEEVPERRSLFSGARAIALVVGVLVVALAVLLGTRLFHGVTTDGPPQVFEADESPMKGPPPLAAAEEDDRPGKAIYDRVEGGDAASAKLVERPAAPVDVLPGVGTSSGNGLPVGENGTVMEPRRVRTVVVRPDGTIVPGQTSESTAVPETAADTLPEPLPQTDRSAMADLAVAGAAEPAAVASAETAAAPVEEPAASAVTAEPVGQPQGALRLPERRPATPPTRTAAAAPQAVAPAPAAPATSNGPMSLIPGTQTQTRPTQTPEETTAPAGSFVVQVTSQRTREAALAAYQQLQRKFPSVLGGRAPSIQAANLGAKGTYYRVRIPGGSQAQAAQLCSRLKAAGGDCVVTRN